MTGYGETMVLRCSLLGHDYGDSEVEREREERGSEVVVTVREYEECVRCGDRDVVSENTEVRSLSSPADADLHPDEAEPTPAGERASETGADATFIDADETDSDANAATAPPTKADTPAATAADNAEDEIDLPTDENGEPVTDDGEILTDEGTTSRDRDRDHGEWPDSDDVGPPVDAERDPAQWPTDDADTADDAVQWPDEESEPIDDAVLLDTGSDDAPTATETESPDETASGPPAAQQTAADQGSGIERVGEAPTPGSEGGVPSDRSAAELYCPRCEFAAGSDRNSLRTGDICPECKKGYLSSRDRS
jgi:hypothetical protein